MPAPASPYLPRLSSSARSYSARRSRVVRILLHAGQYTLGGLGECPTALLPAAQCGLHLPASSLPASFPAFHPQVASLAAPMDNAIIGTADQLRSLVGQVPASLWPLVLQCCFLGCIRPLPTPSQAGCLSPIPMIQQRRACVYRPMLAEHLPDRSCKRNSCSHLDGCGPVA